MSDETKRALDEAMAVAITEHAKGEARKQACLDAVAEGIPAAVDRLAKRIAQAQPDVTRGLGAAGVKALREELATEAADLAAYVRAGSEKVQWPKRDSEWSHVEPRKIHSALFKLMYGAPLNRVGNVFGRHGYDVRKTDRSGQGLRALPGLAARPLVLPQSLYSEESFGDVAAALNDLGAAEIALAKAKAVDDKDVVDSLWDDG